MTFLACSSPTPTRVKPQPAPAILSQESVHTTLSITHHTRKWPSTGPRTTHDPHMSNFCSISLVYLVWLMNVPCLSCLIGNSRKNFNSPIIDILNLLVIILLNSSTQAWLVEPNIMSSTYIWHTNKSLPCLRVKRVGTAFPISKPFFNRNSLRHSYHAHGACLSP
jgi:hypothetical protein